MLLVGRVQNRIVPDCIKNWNNSSPVSLRNPYSTRPWQHVLEPLGAYMLLAAKLDNDSHLSGEAFNFGPSLTKIKLPRTCLFGISPIADQNADPSRYRYPDEVRIYPSLN